MRASIEIPSSSCTNIDLAISFPSNPRAEKKAVIFSIIPTIQAKDLVKSDTKSFYEAIPEEQSKIAQIFRFKKYFLFFKTNNSRKREGIALYTAGAFKLKKYAL